LNIVRLIKVEYKAKASRVIVSFPCYFKSIVKLLIFWIKSKRV
jgi:hypothetical protein